MSTITIWIEGQREETSKDMPTGDIGCSYCDYVHENCLLQDGEIVFVQSNEQTRAIKCVYMLGRLMYLCGPKE